MVRASRHAGERNHLGVPLIEVTPEMIAAGLEELRDHHLGDDWPYVLESVFRAMLYESKLASSINEPK
jgi:hypothetical protein